MEEEQENLPVEALNSEIKSSPNLSDLPFEDRPIVAKQSYMFDETLPIDDLKSEQNNEQDIIKKEIKKKPISKFKVESKSKVESVDDVVIEAVKPLVSSKTNEQPSDLPVVEEAKQQVDAPLAPLTKSADILGKLAM